MLSNKKYLSIWILIFWVSATAAQHIVSESDFKEVYTFYNQTNKTGMWVLGSWSVGNILFSGFSLGSTKGEQRYFHQMNVAWNAVNLTLAGFGLYDAYQPEYQSWQETLQKHHKIQKILLFNAGLDVGYIMTGMFLIEKSKNTKNTPERLLGFGKSLVVQGAFLLLFDGAMVFAHQKNGRKIERILEKVSLSANGFTIRHCF